MRLFTVSLMAAALCVPAIAPAQTGTSPNDPNAAPQGKIGEATGDTQANARAMYREAQARCRKVTPARQRQDCVAQAMKDLDKGPRTLTPGVEVRPASSPEPEASAASR